MATRKALGSTITNPRTGLSHTAKHGRHQTKGSAAKSKHTATAMGFKYGSKQGSKGGGTSKATRGILGKATSRYEKRNTTRRPNSR